MKSKERIFELDAARGICIIGMVVVHFFLNYYDFFKNSQYPAFLQFFFDWGGVLFVLLSGIAVTLGHHPIKRGLIVFLAGMVCTGITFAMEWMGFGVIPIRFGILHCLGICMLLSPMLLRFPNWLLPILSGGILVTSYYFDALVVDCPYLFPLGIRYWGFSSGDYFPLFPYLGYFILGILLGTILYPNKTSRLTKINSNIFPIPFLCWCGKQSLWIYLAHQPILYGLFYGVTLL